MSLADQPAYLQPRIRHITSIRIHRLTIEHDDIEDAIHGRGQQAPSGPAGLNGTYGKNDSTIEGYDLAVSQKVSRPKPVDGQVCRAGMSEQMSIPVTEDGPEPIERMITHIVEEERAAKGLSDPDAKSEINDSLRVGNSDQVNYSFTSLSDSLRCPVSATALVISQSYSSVVTDGARAKAAIPLSHFEFSRKRPRPLVMRRMAATSDHRSHPTPQTMRQRGPVQVHRDRHPGRSTQAAQALSPMYLVHRHKEPVARPSSVDQASP